MAVKKPVQNLCLHWVHYVKLCAFSFIKRSLGKCSPDINIGYLWEMTFFFHFLLHAFLDCLNIQWEHFIFFIEAIFILKTQKLVSNFWEFGHYLLNSLQLILLLGSETKILWREGLPLWEVFTSSFYLFLRCHQTASYSQACHVTV